jgi:hypothetical protein
MKTFLKSMIAAAAITVAATSAQAITLFQYQQTDTAVPSVQLVNNSPNYTLSTIGSQSITATIAGVQYANSTLTFTANGNGTATTMLGVATQPLTSGTLSITNGATNLLSFAFSDGILFGAIGASTGAAFTLASSTLTGVSSDVADFVNQYTLTGFSIGLSGISPALVVAGGTIANFTASSVGTFDVTDDGGPGGIPEPGTWAMMLAGFGLVGLSRRRQRSTVVTA